MESTTEKLMKGFTELCEELVSNAYVVTDGRAVMSTVLDHALAVHLCQLAGRKFESKSWRVVKIDDAIELAYRTGYNEASKENDIEQDPKLRECDLQQQEKSD